MFDKKNIKLSFFSVNRVFLLFFVIVITIGLLDGAVTLHYNGRTQKNALPVYSWEVVWVTWVLLTSPNKNNRQEWKSYVMQSESFFWGWLYLLTKKEAKNLLKELAAKGIDIRLLMENKQYKDYSNSWQHLQSEFANTSVQLKSDEHLGLNFNHTKTFVNDYYAFIQTANLTHSSFEKNIEHFFVTENYAIRKNIVDLFDADWNNVSFWQEHIHPNLLVCPINCRKKISDYLWEAEFSIVVMHQYLTDDELSAIVEQKIEDWLDVRLILSNNDHNYVLVRDWWKDVVTIKKRPYVHTKMILIDDKYLIIGSMNLSTNALDNNREIGIIVTDKEIIAAFMQQIK